MLPSALVVLLVSASAPAEIAPPSTNTSTDANAPLVESALPPAVAEPGRTVESAGPSAGVEIAGVQIGWGGFLRVIAEAVKNDPVSAFIGRNDGFRLGNARLDLTAKYGDSLGAHVSLEATTPRTEDLNDANAELTVGLRDAYLAYALSVQAALRVGRFKAPHDIGELEETEDRVFIDPPLESRGVLPTQGFETRGMSPGRQIGVMLHGDRVGLSEGDGFDAGYALALTNGRTDNLALNDNDRPAGFARFSLFYGAWIDLNMGVFTDTRTKGELPDLFEEEVKGAELSVVVRFEDLRVEMAGLFQRTEFPTSGSEAISALGTHAQWSYRFSAFEAAYRFAYFDPNDLFDIDAVTEHTFGLSYNALSLPLRFSLNGTVVREERGRELQNDRIALLSQYIF